MPTLMISWTLFKNITEISMDLEDKNYCGLTIDWNYNKEYTDIYMQIYISKDLKSVIHHAPKN